METAAISIKVKGADAIRILTRDGQLLVGLKGKGAAAAAKGAVKVGELEATRAAAVGKGVALRSLEVEGGRVVGAGKALTIQGGEVEATYVVNGTGTAAKTMTVPKGVVAAKAASGKVAAASGKAAAKAAVVAPVVAGAALAPGQAALAAGKGAATSAGTIWTGTGFSLGLGLGLGALGPILVVSALGLIATGVYLYRRNQRWVPYAEEEA